MITLRAWTVARLMGVAIIFLVFASIAMQTIAVVSGYQTMHGLVRFFDLDQEMNLPTWYASATLLFSSFLLALIGVAEGGSGGRARSWMGLSAIFAILSMDEAASFHEIFIAPTRSLLGVGGALYFAWIVPAAVLLLIIIMAYARWFLGLPRRTKKLMALSGILFIGGGMGIEMFGGYFASRGELNSPMYLASATIEEAMEMSGVLLWVYSLLDYAGARNYKVTVSCSAPCDL